MTRHEFEIAVANKLIEIKQLYMEYAPEANYLSLTLRKDTDEASATYDVWGVYGDNACCEDAPVDFFVNRETHELISLDSWMTTIAEGVMV